jgi:lipid IVA palmitoyltransferase
VLKNHNKFKSWKKLKHWLIALLILMRSTTALAEEPTELGLWSRVQDSLSQTWGSTNYEMYIPVNTWHNRHFYSSEKIDGYNERPWGLGIGKYRFDEDGDWHGLYVMAFQDSHSDVEPVVGYGFQKVWRPADDVRLGAGYTVGVTIRHEQHYIPLPVIAPLFSVEYKQVAVQSTYIPGGNGHGNILFTWLRWQLQ